MIKIKVLCPRSGSHRKVKQNDKLHPVQDTGSLAVFKVTARDQGHYTGPSGAFVTYCNVSCFRKKRINICFGKNSKTGDLERTATYGKERSYAIYLYTAN